MLSYRQTESSLGSCKKEYAHAAGFESWYERQQEEMRKDGLLTFFNNLRVTSIHTKQVQPKVRFSLPVADLFSMPSGSTIVMGDKNKGTYLTNASVAEVAGTDVTKIGAEQRWLFDEKPEVDVITLCERYLSIYSGLELSAIPMLFLLVFYYSLNKVKSIFGCMLIIPVSNVRFKADKAIIANFVKAFYHCRKINMGKSWHFSIVIGKVHMTQKRA